MPGFPKYGHIWTIIHCGAVASGKVLAFSARGPSFESGTGNFWFLYNLLQWLELGCGFTVCYTAKLRMGLDHVSLATLHNFFLLNVLVSRKKKGYSNIVMNVILSSGVLRTGSS